MKIENLIDKLVVMFNLQESMNAMVVQTWRDKRFAWHRAIYTEGAELLEHLGEWKWWKKGQPDLAQAKMELVDIWHFGLSLQLQGWAAHAIAELAELEAVYITGFRPRDDLSFATCTAEERHQLIDSLVRSAGEGNFNRQAFLALLASLDMSFDDLYRGYIGKNMLNRFRQQHGYKEGTYVKTWDGKEDNVHLDEILQGLPADAELPEKVLAALAARYPQV